MKIRQFESLEQEARIELIPLLDVVFCILIFFLFATLQLTRQQAIEVNLPSARTGQPQQRQLLVVSIDALGQTFADQQPIPLDLLALKLKDFQERNPQALMVLYADRDASYSEVVRVLDLMRSIGGDRVALATLPPHAQTPASPSPGLTAPTQQSPALSSPGIPSVLPSRSGLQSPLPQTPLPQGSPQIPQSFQPSVPGQSFQQPMPAPTGGYPTQPAP
jgi:biopolymer transport protein ExbD